MKIFDKEVSTAVTFIGLEYAGKTTLLTRLKGQEPEKDYIPTMGMNIEVISFEGLDLLAVDLGGQKEFRESYWETQIKKAAGIVFVFDSADPTKVEEASKWLKKSSEWARPDAAFLFLANKKDLPDAMPLEKIIETLQLRDVMSKRPHSFAVHQISALYNDGVDDAWKWLLERVQSATK